MYIPTLAGSPNLAGKQQKHLESLLEKGGLYSVLGKLLLAAGWIVFHTLVPLFLDASWDSVLTRGEWHYWSRNSSIKHGREGKAKDLSWLKEDNKLRFSSLFYHWLSVESFSHPGDSGLAVTLWLFLLIAFACICCREIWSETRHHPYQWSQDNCIANNCWKACPLNSVKWSLCYYPPCFLFVLFPAILPIWFIPCCSG